MRQVMGLSANVVFVTHEELEQGEEDKAGIGGTRSKINAYECSFAVLTTRYLMQQG